MRPHLIPLPLPGAVEELVVDRRTGQSWTVRVEPIALSDTVVTRGLWDDVHGLTADPGTADLPKTDVSWRDAVTFCNTLSLREGLTPAYSIARREMTPPTGWRPHSRPEPDDWVVSWDHGADGYRLPTDAEWQVACRAGTTGARYGRLDDIAWYADNPGGTVHPVASKEPNGWGLFDLLGGVWEWCWDLYDPELYFDLSMDELREVTRFAVAPVEEAMRLVAPSPDVRITAAVDAARRFVEGGPRSRLQRTAALDAHRAAREALDPVSHHVAAAAGDAAASAYLHPFAKADQVGHILRSTAHAALAAEAAGGGADSLTSVLDEAVRRATPVLREVLHRYPPFPTGRSRVAQVTCELDLSLRRL